MLRVAPSKVERLATFVRDADMVSLTAMDIEDLGFTPTESHQISKSIKQVKMGEVLSAFLKMTHDKRSVSQKTVRLVVTGDIMTADADYTHETIYQMINRARSSITVVGYWMYNVQALIEEMSSLQIEKNLNIKFVLDSAPKWKRQIMRAWNKKCRPAIFEADSTRTKALHAKAIAVDRNELLITSANLTINALAENIETGIWTSDRNVIDSFHDVLQELEESGILRPVRWGV